MQEKAVVCYEHGDRYRNGRTNKECPVQQPVIKPKSFLPNCSFLKIKILSLQIQTIFLINNDGKQVLCKLGYSTTTNATKTIKSFNHHCDRHTAFLFCLPVLLWKEEFFETTRSLNGLQVKTFQLTQ